MDFSVSCTMSFDLTSQAAPGSGHVVCSPHPDFQLPAVGIYALVTKDFSRYGPRIGLIDGKSGQQLSYNRIRKATRRFSSGLQRLGFAKGDVLVIVAPNTIEYPIVYLGTLAAGGVVSPSNPTS